MKTTRFFVLISLIPTLVYANSDIEITKAFELYKNEKYTESIKICEDVLQKERDNLDALYVAAISHFMLQNYQDAEKLFNKFLQINPYNYEVIRYLAISRYYNGDYRGSISAFERIPRYTEDPLILIYLALNYNRLEDKDNLKAIIEKIEKSTTIDHVNKKEFLSIIHRAMDGDLDGTLSGLKSLRERYQNQFIISSKIISIEKNMKTESSENFRLFIAINEVFDTNVILYPDNDAIKSPELKYNERYDFRTEARYSIGYKLINTTSNVMGLIYNGYQGINANIHQYNFNANALQLNYRYTKPSFYLGLKYDYTYDFISNDFNAYSFGHHLQPEFGYRISDVIIAAGSSVALRHYFEKVYSSDFDRSGILIDPYLLLSYSPTTNLTIYNKDSFGINNSDGDAWRYTRPDFKLGLNYKYGKSITLNMNGGFAYYIFSEKISNPDYLKDNKVDARNDRRITFDATIDFRLYRENLYLNIGYALLMNMSSVKSGLYDYSRHIASIGLKFIY